MDTTPADGPVDESAGSPPHEHWWSGVAFFLEDDRPWFRMRCACGAERTIRAWERYSDPDAPPDETAGPVAGSEAATEA